MTNPNPSPIGIGFGFVLFGASVHNGLEWKKSVRKPVTNTPTGADVLNQPKFHT